MRTFTIILEYSGGTYISQYRGRSPRKALQLWAKLEPAKLSMLDGGITPELLARATDQPPTPLDGLVGVWSVTAADDSELALVTIVATAVED